MRQVTVERRVNAPRADVWGVLADFPGISRWNSGVKASAATSEATAGVGASRHCDLAPAGTLEETITEWSPDERLVIRIDSATKLPIAHGLVTFDLIEDGSATSTTVVYEYEPKFGPLGSLLGPVLDRQLRKGFEGFLADLEKAAQQDRV